MRLLECHAFPSFAAARLVEEFTISKFSSAYDSSSSSSAAVDAVVAAAVDVAVDWDRIVFENKSYFKAINRMSFDFEEVFKRRNLLACHSLNLCVCSVFVY